MYQITCDGFPLLDFRDNNMVLVNPRVRLEVNTSGESSFTIYKNHPHYDKLKKLKSVIEISDGDEVIFRGRITGDSVNFDNGLLADVEGVLAFFNDSVVRPVNFPDDFLKDADYITAAESGNVVAFFLGWLIDNHNSQVQDFQKMKLGNVTVTMPDNYLGRSVGEIASTWEVLRSKLFDSTLGGYLCIRYEADGNYIDYLSAFTETNSQEIAFGENLLDLKRETEGSSTYSAIIPIGAAGLTIEGLADKEITSDIVKSGDTLYSKSAVEAYGWIYAPVSETTWDDIVDDVPLQAMGANWLANHGVFLNAMDATAVDLHFTDEQVESLRIYKNVKVKSVPHDVTETLPLKMLEIDILNPQNTKITVGKTMMTLTEQTVMLQEEAKKRYSKLSKNDDEIRLLAENLEKEIGHTLRVAADGVTIEDMDGNTVTISGGQVDATKIKTDDLDASKIKTEDLNLSGVISWGDLSEETQKSIEDMSGLDEDAVTVITQNGLSTGTIKVYRLNGRYVYLYDAAGNNRGAIAISEAASASDAIELSSEGAMRLTAKDGHVFINSDSGGNLQLGGGVCKFGGGALVLGSNNWGYTLPSTGVQGQVFFLLS